jgi:hypothetical protein
MKKNIIKRIIEEAIKLPNRTETQSHTEYFTGDEANKAQREYGDTGIKFNPKEVYPSTTPIVLVVNHVERMKDAYKKGGWREVQKYISQNQGDGEVVSRSTGE